MTICVPIVPERAMTEPTEMSRAPEMSPNVAPVATIMSTAVARPVFSRLVVLRKRGAAMLNTTNSATMTTPSVTHVSLPENTRSRRRCDHPDASAVALSGETAVIGIRPWVAGRTQPPGSWRRPRR